jgi:pentatricopeptide repeat protein
MHSSQWNFVKHFAPKITPSLISTTIINLHKTPDLSFQFVIHIGFNGVDIRSRYLAMAATSHAPNPKPTLQLLKETNNNGAYSIREVFNELGVARDVLGGKSYVFYDLLIRACCELKRSDDAFECFDMMKGKGVIPCVHACNDILSLFLKLNTTEKARVLYA